MNVGSGTSGNSMLGAGSPHSEYQRMDSMSAGSYSARGSPVSSSQMDQQVPSVPALKLTQIKSMHPTSPLSVHRHRLSSESSGSAGQYQPVEPPRSAITPRIPPPDSRKPAPAQEKMRVVPTDAPPSFTHPRRSTNSPAAFLRQATSHSSTSEKSANSGASSQITPDSSNDESRASRILPPLVGQGHRYDSAQSGFPPLAPKSGGAGYAGKAPTSNIGG